MKKINNVKELKIDFLDSILSDMTIKKLFVKWITLIDSDIKLCLYKYYMKNNNIDFEDKKFVIMYFNETSARISFIIPILEDLVNENIYGLEDIFIAVYGIDSDEVYALRKFFTLNDKINEWDEDYMWNDCISDQRLLKILSR